MPRSVTIRTPVPTLEQFGEELGLSKARRRTLAPVYIERRGQGEYVVRKRGMQRASGVFSTQKEAVERARELSPNRMILIERIRDTANGGLDRWRKA